MWEKRDAKNNPRSYGMEQKLGSERRDNRTLSGTLNLDMFGVMGALKLITCVLTHGRKGCKRESNNCPHKDIREFKQIATATSTTAVVDAVSWGEYVS